MCIIDEYIKNDFNKTATADALGISRVTLYSKMDKFINDKVGLGLSWEQFEKEFILKAGYKAFKGA
jgi:hypothetical protein